MTEITFANGPQGGRIYWLRPQPLLPAKVMNSNFVSCACVMNVNDRTNVSCLELFTRQVRRQYNRIMFFDRHRSSKGFAVKSAAVNGRTLRTSSLRKDSRADSGTAVTAMVSPRALNTSIE